MATNNFVKYADLLTVNGVDPETDKEKFVFIPAEGEYIFGKYAEGKKSLKKIIIFKEM